MELYAIKYGESLFNIKFIYQDLASSEVKTEFIWLYYLAKYNGKIILFDTGFRNKHEASKWGVNMIDVESEVGKLIDGLDRVDIVFITHSHFDHIGNLDLYEDSTIIIAKKEFENALKKAPHSVKKRLRQGNVIKVDEEYIYDNKFHFKVIGGHTAGSSVIYFDESCDSYVITGDECYVCENVFSIRPIGAYVDGQKNLMFLKKAYENGLKPLPFHDVNVFEVYEHISENIVRIL